MWINFKLEILEICVFFLFFFSDSVGEIFINDGHWTLDKFDSHIVVSFVNATLVLSIGETVEEVTDSGFLGTTPTLGCALIGDDALLQVSGSFLL